MFSLEVALVRERALKELQFASRVCVLIDGPSGSGKSTLATELADGFGNGCSLVRLDDMYPGWGGLVSASATAATLVRNFVAGLPVQWTRWDWYTNHFAETRTLPATTRILVMEGCGALSRAAARSAGVRVWVAASDPVRKRRALARDAGAFDPFWDMWDAQFAAFVAAEGPAALANLSFDTTGKLEA